MKIIGWNMIDFLLSSISWYTNYIVELMKSVGCSLSVVSIKSHLIEISGLCLGLILSEVRVLFIRHLNYYLKNTYES